MSEFTTLVIPPGNRCIIPFMSNTLQHHHSDVNAASVSEDQKSLAVLYDEHAAVVLGFLEKIADDRAKAEEILQAVFLALPERLHEFDPQKGRFVVWLLKLTRTIAGPSHKARDFKTNRSNAATNHPIHEQAGNVHAPGADKQWAHQNSTRPLMVGKEISVVELLYVKGYTFAQAAAELGVDESMIRLLVRTELKKYRRS